jgi:hypothetical protein
LAKKVAKKKKGARKAAPRRARTAASRTASPAPHIAATRDGKVTWKKEPKQIVLTPLKAILAAHIDRLSAVTDPSDDVLKTLETLQQTKAALGSICGLSMVVPTT